jgi:hypothetical protein
MCCAAAAAIAADAATRAAAQRDNCNTCPAADTCRVGGPIEPLGGALRGVADDLCAHAHGDGDDAYARDAVPGYDGAVRAAAADPDQDCGPG